jgi:hypothetical protein
MYFIVKISILNFIIHFFKKFSCIENLFTHSTIFTDLPKFTDRKIEKSLTFSHLPNSVKIGNSGLIQIYNDKYLKKL